MALIPPFFLDCVVAIGMENNSKEINWVASGFLYGHFMEKVGDQDRYLVYLVTNRHVFENQESVWLRFNPTTDEKAHTWRLPLIDGNKSLLWHSCADTQKDVAVIPVNVRQLGEQGMQFSYFQSDKNVATIKNLIELGITEGDYAYLLGFPMGLLGGDRNYVIVRSGSIARIRDMVQGVSNNFLIDAFVFPGNSGGPAILKPELVAISGTKTQGSACLIGIVTSYVPYSDVAISTQTKRPRVIFEENSGLSAIQPIDFVQEAILEHLKKT